MRGRLRAHILVSRSTTLTCGPSLCRHGEGAPGSSCLQRSVGTAKIFLLGVAALHKARLASASSLRGNAPTRRACKLQLRDQENAKLRDRLIDINAENAAPKVGGQSSAGIARDTDPKSSQASTVAALQAPFKQESGGLVKADTLQTQALAMGQTRDLFRQQSLRHHPAGSAARQ